MNKNLLAGLVAALFSSGASAFQAFVIKDIRVDGIQRTEAGTVFSYLPLKVGDTMTDEKAAQSIKALFATGFFKDVRIEIAGEVVVVAVEERPAIAQIDFVGLKEFDKEQLSKSLKEAGFAVSRSFDRSMLEKAEQELKRQYLTRGKYSVAISTTVTPLERNRVAINFNIDEGDAAKIKQINIVGAQAFSEKELADLFQLKPPNWISWFTKDDQYSKQKLSADLETLRSHYLNSGYLEFNIESTQVSISSDKKDIYITITVSEGGRYLVSSVKLAGDLILPEDEFKKAMRVKPGDVFSREKLNDSTKAISERLSAKGYAFANVNAAPEIDKEKKQVAFTVFVDPGRRAYVRRINISGNTKTRDEVIRREMRQMEGSWYDDERVKLSKQRVDNTDYFSEVTVETPPVPGTTDQVDVNISVAEKPTGNISLGLGFSQSEKVMLSASITQANLFGSGKTVGVQVATGSINRTIGLSYDNPYFTVDGISQGFDILHLKKNPTTLDYAYKIETTRGGVTFGIPIGERQRISFGGAIDYSSVDVDLDDEDTPVKYKNFNKTFCNNDEQCSYVSVPLTAGWTRNTKDSAINPTRGTYQRVGFEVSPTGDLKYYKATYQHQWFYPFMRNVVFMLNGEFGYVNGLNNQEVPFFKAFNVGGVGSVRGYQTSSLGPYEISSTGNVTRLGGVRKVVLNAELQTPLPSLGLGPSLRFGPFFDAGQVYGDGKSAEANEGPIRMSVGLAATWLSPFGPLKFSLAKALNKQDNDKLESFQFQMGQTF